MIDAVTRQSRIPELLDGNANEDEQEGDADNPGPHKGADEPRHALEEGNSKDAVVHEQDAQLGPAEVPGVEDLGDDEPFRHHDNVWRINFIGVNAHAVNVHGKNKTNNRQIPCLFILQIRENELARGIIA